MWVFCQHLCVCKAFCHCLYIRNMFCQYLHIRSEYLSVAWFTFAPPAPFVWTLFGAIAARAPVQGRAWVAVRARLRIGWGRSYCQAVQLWIWPPQMWNILTLRASTSVMASVESGPSSSRLVSVTCSVTSCVYGDVSVCTSEKLQRFPTDLSGYEHGCMHVLHFLSHGHNFLSRKTVTIQTLKRKLVLQKRIRLGRWT